jgi:hypothetical protein
MKRRLIPKATQSDAEDVGVVPQIRRQAPQNRTQIASLHKLDNLLEKRVKHQPKHQLDPEEPDQQLQELQPKKHTKKFGMMPQIKPKSYLAETYPKVLDH